MIILTTEEKLQHFLESSMKNSRIESNQLIEDYSNALEKIFKEHQEDVKRKAALEIKVEKDKIRREGNKELAKEQLVIKRKLSKKHTELTDKIFVEVKDLLENFMSTKSYIELLIKQIREAKEFAKGDDIIIYIDPADTSKIYELQEATAITLKVSQYSFGGGTRAVLPKRNILIDNSFETKLAEAQENFRFDGGISHV